MTFFEILAECSIAFAGFGAVHAALRGSTGARGFLRAWTVVTQGVLAFVLSLLPMLLELAPLFAEALWRIASAVGVVGTGAASYSFVAFDLRLARLGHPPQALPLVRTAQLASLLATLAMLLNLVGAPLAPGPLLYAAALVLILVAGLTALLHSFLVPLQLILGGKDPGDSDSPAGG